MNIISSFRIYALLCLDGTLEVQEGGHANKEYIEGNSCDLRFCHDPTSYPEVTLIENSGLRVEPLLCSFIPKDNTPKQEKHKQFPKSLHLVT